MSTIRLSRLLGLRAAAVLALFVSSLTTASAWDQSRVSQPGSFEAIMSYKMPGIYGPHLAQPPEDPNQHFPSPGSAEALARAKTPWLFPASAKDTGLICPNAYRYPPGSYQAIMASKDPGHFGPKSCKSAN